jgi:transcriptional regulator with XRE-family HTH domain
MAEKLNTNRSGVLRYERNEVSKKITLQSLQAWAKATDCEFVYGFLPKEHPTFSHLIVSRCLPFLNDDWLQNLPTERKARTMHARLMSFLGHKNGWSKIWGHTNILKKSNYSWFNSKKHLYY